MFPKSTFSSTGTGFGTFNATATASPFAQSAFAKPATTFGAAPAFGTQSAAPMFGAAPAQAPSTGLFGAANTSTAFGTTTPAQPAFGGTFVQPQQNTSIFGATQPAANTGSLFGQPTTSTFGSAVKPAGLGGFGQTTAPGTTSLFGQTPTTGLGTTSFSTFSQTAGTTTNAFGAAAPTAFGQPTAAAAGVNSGTSIAKYQPVIGTDTLMKGGQPNNVSTKQHCITSMKEYEVKSLEELRMEDYWANRKGPQASTSGAFFSGATAQPATTGLFGNTTQPTAGGLFGQTGVAGAATDNKNLFNTSAFAPTGTTAFGAPAQQQQNSFLGKPFGTATAPGFGAATNDASANPFGTKPAFGQAQAPSLFGQTPAVSAAPPFGQTATSVFAGFGAAPTAQQPTMFGQPAAADANKPAFGMGAASTANTGFGFNTATSTAAGTSMFGAKPATGFGTLPAFGATSTANTGFNNFSLNNTGGGMFNTSGLNKSAATGFNSNFGAQTSTAPLNFNTGTTSFFGNAAQKPGSLFSGTLGGANTTNTSGGLFGGTNAFGTSLGGGSAFGGGATTLGGGAATLGGIGGGGIGGGLLQQQSLPIHQQILSKVISPYGDNPIFKDLKRIDETDATRATNPAAQKAILETSANASAASQFKVTSKASPSTIKIKPVGSALTKKSLFDGLEEFDPTVETFTLKPNAKRLIIKPKANNIANGSQANTPNTSVVDSPLGTPQRYNNNINNNNNLSSMSLRNESFNGEIPSEPPTSSSGTTTTTGRLEGGSAGGGTTTGHADSTNANEIDFSHRESWLHPNNLEEVRRMNAGRESLNVPLNSTLTELVPRKPLETYRASPTTVGGTPTRALNTTNMPPSSTTSAMAEQQHGYEEHSTLSNANDTSSILSTNRSYIGGIGGAVSSEIILEDDGHEEHPTGIVLRRVGYYTIPTLDDLKSYLAEDGSCIVPNFTVGREGYGNVYFGKEMDVAGLNLDEIVHFRNKQVIIYPDDDNKPPIGSALNREAQVTLDQVWPHDKTKHEAIKDPTRLAEMDWESKLRRICDKNDTRFVEYRPETGSWVFRVKHFSKYGLSDSDEEDDVPTDPKKAKLAVAQGAAAPIAGQDKITLAALKNAQKISEDAARSLDPKALAAGMASANGNFYAMDESAEFMLMDKTQFFQTNGNDLTLFDQPMKNSFQAAANATSPSAAIARESGADAHKLQLMKASLFIDDDGNDIDDGNASVYEASRRRAQRSNATNVGADMYTSSQSLWKEAAGMSVHSETSSQLDFGLNGTPPPQPLPPSSATSVLSVIRESQETSTPAPGSDTTVAAAAKLPPFIVKPKVALVRSLAAQVPFATSIAYPLRNRWPCDLGLYNSRKFKFSWGPQNALIVPTTRNMQLGDVKNMHLFDALPHIFKLRPMNDFSPMVLQHVKISATQHYDHFRDSIADHLHIQLRNSLQVDVEGSECPWIRSDNGTDLIVKHLDEAIKQINLSPLEEYAVSVWSLCLALWGEHEELEGREPSSHFTIMCRRNLLSEWLENTLTDNELLKKNVTKQTYLDHMLDLIMCHKVTDACELAFKYDDANLALLLSQLSSGPVVRQLMEDQLAAWHNDEADTFIQLERLKMFMLVAGVSLMVSAHGPINTLENIEWLKVLAIQLWYLSSPTSSITDALFAYDKSFKSEEFYSLPPVPSYTEKLNSNGNKLEDLPVFDLRYHLLQLYSKRSHSMESLLNPATHTADPMDYRLSWLILQTLEALGYRHCSDLCESQIHIGFAAQLENNNLWQWAIFVLLHIKDRNQRELAVQNMLYRYVSVSKDVLLTAEEKFVINNLGVPEKWIDYAKAVKAGSIGDHHLQAKYLLKAKQWALAHEVIFQHIAPDAIINDNLDYLHNLLSQFEGVDPNKSVKVPNWSNQGQIFLDFIDINEKFKGLKTLKTPADIEAHWENLKPQLADLCSRINLLPCPTAKHRLCQSEIAQNLACLVRGVLLVCPVLNPCLIIKIALERLPLPQEFAQQELRTLLDALVNDMSKSYVSNNSPMEN